MARALTADQYHSRMAPRKAAVLRERDDDPSLREYLIATALRMLTEPRAAAPTVREIARAAGVADGVLYNHFSDKEELLAHAVRAHVRAVEHGLGALPEPGTRGVEANLRAYLKHGLALHRAIMPMLSGPGVRPKVLSRFADLVGPGDNWRDHLVRYLHAERDLGRIASDANVDAAAALLVGVCHELVLSLLISDGHASPLLSPASENSETDDGGETGGVPRVEEIIAVVLKGIARSES